MDRVDTRILRINSCGKTHCQPNWSWDSNTGSGQDYDLWAVLEGQGTLTTQGVTYSIGTGDCLVLDTRYRCIGGHNPEKPLTVINIHFDFMDDAGYPYKRNPPIAIYRNLYNTSFFIELLHRVLHHYTRNERYHASCWLNAALSEIEYQDNAPDLFDDNCKLVNSICATIQKHPERQYRLATVAKDCGYSPDYFGRIFHRITGLSFSKYLIRIRVELAKNLLRTSDYTIGELSLMLGYNDLAFFSKIFKQTEGVSPRKYRNNEMQ